MGEDREKQEEHSLKNEIQIRIRNMSTSDTRASNSRIIESLQDLAEVCFLSSQLVANELKLLREDLKKSQK